MTETSSETLVSGNDQVTKVEAERDLLATILASYACDCEGDWCDGNESPGCGRRAREALKGLRR